MQVPRSANFIQEDNEYALFSFILFRKIVDSFKSEARQRGWQVRPAACHCSRAAKQLRHSAACDLSSGTDAAKSPQ